MENKIKLNKAMLMDRIGAIREDVARLKLIRTLSLSEFKINPDNYAVAEHHLRRASESVLDIGRHIIAKSDFGKAMDYTEIIDILGQNNVIPLKFAKEFRKIGGFRNRLVHVYWNVSPEELYNVIKNDLNKLTDFCRYILKYIENR